MKTREINRIIILFTVLLLAGMDNLDDIIGEGNYPWVFTGKTR